MIIGIIKRTSGSVATVHFNTEWHGDRLAHLNEIKNDGDLVELIDDSLLPDRYFRDAWNHDLDIDLIKAREIHLANLRQERDDKLKNSDIKLSVAIEQGDTEKENALKVKRQSLRDMPAAASVALEALTDPALIKVYRPTILDEVL